MNNTPIYLDYAATSPMYQEVIEVMKNALAVEFGNASTSYQIGASAKDTLELSRETIARSIGAEPSEIYFTSGGTESDNWALIAGAEAAGAERSGAGFKGHIVTTAIEHHAVLHTAEYLAARGYKVTIVKPDEKGMISPDSILRELREDTILVSVMAANNEIGTIEPIRQIAGAVKTVRSNILVHTDAVQAFGKIPLDVRELGVDLLSVSGHKLGGPKGTGFLYIRSGVKIGAFMHGGNQERGRRAGTENVPAIAAFAKAVELSLTAMEREDVRLRELQSRFEQLLRKKIPEFARNGADGEHSLPGYLNIYIPGVKAETLLIVLDLQGVCCSAGSACTTGALDPSHVLRAIGCSKERAEESLRITMGRDTTWEQLVELSDMMQRICDRQRK